MYTFLTSICITDSHTCFTTFCFPPLLEKVSFSNPVPIYTLAPQSILLHAYNAKGNYVRSTIHIANLHTNLFFNLYSNPLSFPFFNTFTIFSFDRFLLASLWSSSLTLEVPARPPKRSSQSQISQLHDTNLISPSRISLHVRFQWIPNPASLPLSDAVDQLVKEAELIGTLCPTFLIQNLIPHLANIIKFNWTLHYISHTSVARYNSIQHSPPSQSWFHNQSLSASFISAI